MSFFCTLKYWFYFLKFFRIIYPSLSTFNLEGYQVSAIITDTRYKKLKTNSSVLLQNADTQIKWLKTFMIGRNWGIFGVDNYEKSMFMKKKY